ncbi:lipoprotein-releasing ABC transporter permease subunit [Magnetospira sp. QH-2]|uniref:lipoprotein-releasing ABC transporter permease subunit n=1 Tax=Magnetospira sp. (strain QH-2) TaxID=1288970 RepID=UPI0003E816F3|nr:lipoprotein-releasing ABC transporter permease subunit [Magnetospira sp. QH-2]CCQ74267.1 Lipoprotein releasing system, transmembrane protein, LolC/E family [Magnetospira sp. QH-2]
MRLPSLPSALRIFKPFEWMLALRYLRARRQEGFISVIAWFSLLGIALGVATLIIVMSVMNGFREELLSRILGLNGHLTVQAGPQGVANFDDLTRAVSGIKGVTLVAPVIEGQVMATGRGIANGAMVRGMRPEDLKKRPMIIDNLRTGSVEAFEDGDAVIVGARLAGKMGLTTGDKITLISPKGNVTAFGTVPRMRAYRIAGTFEVGMYEYDSSFIFMPLAAAQKYFKLPDRVSHLELMIEDPYEIKRPRAEVAAVTVGQGRVYDWQQTNHSFFSALQVERNVMFLILTLIIIVAAFNIVSSMIMLVKDKGSDIAILRTMGASRASILKIFFISGASVGTIGTFVGYWLGMLFCWNIEGIRRGIESITGSDLFNAEIYFLSKLPAKVDTWEVVTVVLMGLGLSFLATLYPAWRAARLDPVEALRYE